MMYKKLQFINPTIPWKEYFDLVGCADEFVLYIVFN